MKALRNKASERNPDEFAFGMMSATTIKGVKVTQRGAENGSTGNLSMDVAKLLKTQDAGYLQTILQQTRRDKERTEQELILVGSGVGAAKSGPAMGKKKVFDDDGEVLAQIPTREMPDDSDDEMSNNEGLSREEIQARRRNRRLQDALESRLEALTARETDLNSALNQLEQQRAKMNNTIGGTNKDGVKFKVRERKR